MQSVRRSIIASALVVAGVSFAREPAAATRARVPVTCTRGTSAVFELAASVPVTAREGETYGVRIDGAPTGTIAQPGLRYLHDMSFEIVLPAGAAYVEGSAHVVPGTGSENVRAGARVTHARGVVTLTLPSRVANGAGYTAPSIELQLRVTSQAPASLPVAFARYRVSANVVLLGDIDAACVPSSPFTLGTTRILASPAPEH